MLDLRAKIESKRAVRDDLVFQIQRLRGRLNVFDTGARDERGASPAPRNAAAAPNPSCSPFSPLARPRISRALGWANEDNRFPNRCSYAKKLVTNLSRGLF